MRGKMIISIVLFMLLLVVFGAGGYFLYLRSQVQILDGPGMIYEWKNYLLKTTWHQIECEEKGVTLYIDDTQIVYKAVDGSETRITYSLPEGTDPYGVPSEEVSILMEENPYFSEMIFYMSDTQESDGGGQKAYLRVSCKDADKILYFSNN